MNHLKPPNFQGYFWLPGNADNKVPGRFYCTEEGMLQLDLLGTLSGNPYELDQAALPRILGISEKGELFTLENCFYRKRDVHPSGFPTSSIHVNLALLGCQFEYHEPLQFDEIACHSEAFSDWLEFAPINATWTPSPSQASISFSPPSPLEWNLSTGVKMKLASSWTAPTGSHYRQATITQKTWVGFEFPSAKPLDELLSTVHRFAHFVSFVVDQMIPLHAVEAYSKNFVKEVGTTKRLIPIQIFYTSDDLKSPDLSRISAPFSFISFRYVRERFGELISRWFDNYAAFDSSFNLYFATKRGRDLYLDNRFLMLTQALESLHRHSSDATAFSADSYSALCTFLEKVTPDAFREWLRAKLKYGNELSLRQRLKSLFKGFAPIYGDSNKVKDYIARIVTTRNYLTHYDPSLRAQSASGEQLYKLCLVLEILFQLHMAVMCGLSREEVLDLCSQSERFGTKLARLSQ